MPKQTPASAHAPAAALVCEVTSREPAEQERQFAAFTQRPSVKAGITIASWNNRRFRNANINELVKDLSDQGAKASSGDFSRLESMLAIQAHTLDALFNEYAVLAQLNIREHLPASESFMRLALKAQSQCRATIETLATVKNPPAVAFVKQANIASGHQQVNNGVGSTARGTSIQANELLESHERLERRTSQEASFGNSKMATLEAIHGTKNAGRKAGVEPEQLEARREVA